MTIKELKNNILLALYKRYKEGEMASVGFDKLCSSYTAVRRNYYHNVSCSTASASGTLTGSVG